MLYNKDVENAREVFMNKKIISLLLAIALSVSLILSLSSCMGMLEAMVEYGETQGANTPHSSDDKDTNNNNNNWNKITKNKKSNH